MTDWCCRPLAVPLNDATGDVYRATGSGRDGDEAVSWSVVLKVVHTSDALLAPIANPARPWYWRREALVYASGPLDDLRGLRAPCRYGVVERSDATAWLWLEDLSDRYDGPWQVGR